MTQRDPTPATPAADPLARIAWPLRLTHAGLAAERLVHAFWPVPVILFAAIAALAFGLLDALPLEAAWALAVAVVVALVAALALGARRFRWPRRSDALRRLDATLPGRPLSAITDQQAIGADDPAARRVWEAHLARMAERARAARAVEPDLNLARRDPYALRYVALTALVMALLFGSIWRVAAVSDLAQMPGGGAVANGPSWEGWIQPPAHTGKPALYLNEVDQAAFSVPQGSHVTLRLYGKPGDLTVDETVSGRTGDPGSAAAAAQEFDITRAGRLAIDGPGGRGWQIEVIPDAPPSVAFAGPIRREADGEMRQPFRAADDYGVTGGRAEIALDLSAVDRRHGLAVAPEPREPVVLDLPVPISGSRAEFTETLAENLSQHPFANLPVTIRLTAEDAAGQTGTAELATVLPGRRFFDPLAAAIVEMRRDLLWSRENGVRAAQLLRAISWQPEGFFRNQRAYLQLRVAMRALDSALEAGLAPEPRDEIAQRLWEIAVLIEDGDLGNAAERLARAQDRLSEAIRNGADEQEIAELMRELQEAMQDYIRQLAEQQAQDPDSQTAQDQNGQPITGDQLQQMLDRLQQLMQEGKTAEAAELLEMLRQMMENLRVTQGQGGQGMSPGQQAMRDLAETLRQQQGLSDESFESLQDGPGQPGQQGQGGQGPGQSPQPGQGQGEGRGQGGSGPGSGPGGLAQRQQALRDQLGQQMDRGLPGRGTAEGDAARDALGRAGRAMEEAERALREGRTGEALDRQAEAMEAMREGLRNLGEAMAQESGQQPGEGQPGGERYGQGDPAGRRDPLGRVPGEVGRGIGTEENMLQGEDVYRRAQEILNELRRRSGEQERPQLELDYLRRLLERF